VGGDRLARLELAKRISTALQEGNHRRSSSILTSARSRHQASAVSIS
jgi:hypothetical protein